MLTTKLTICLLLLYTCEVFGRECDDCVLLISCPNGLTEAAKTDTATREKLRRAHCGFGYHENGTHFPKIILSRRRDVTTSLPAVGITSVTAEIIPPVQSVTLVVCCSDINPVEYISNGNFGTQEDIDNHKNIKLLPRDCGPINGERIIGGEFAKLYEFPWMALISMKSGIVSKFICGGTIINSKYILTAAHCVKNRHNQLVGVRVGEYDKNSRTDCQGEPPETICERHLQNIKVDKVKIHPEYRKLPSTINDIALIRLKTPINFDHKNVKPICLPVATSLRNESIGARTATVAGWGVTETGSLSNILRKVDVPILPDDECRVYNGNASGSNTTSTLLCAGEEGKDSCRGDSGGPLMLEMEYEGFYRIYQYGIVSYGPTDCGSKAPGVYTDISKYIKWILDNIEA